jgi:DNA-binding response OmpR family regulator
LAELVDGEPMIRSLARALELYGYKVFESKDGRPAPEVMRSEAGRQADPTLLDVVMPRTDGRELRKLLRRQRSGIGLLYI